jgi:hypothetical protein
MFEEIDAGIGINSLAPLKFGLQLVNSGTGANAASP